MKLNNPYYTEPRKNGVGLCGEWNFTWADEEINDTTKIDWKYKATLPKSVIPCLYETGEFPNPYYGDNSREYRWTDEKVWYFKKKFSLSPEQKRDKAILCFDGISYYSRIWVNNTLIGSHEGMYGGPCASVENLINFNGENEIIAEVKACNYGIKDTFCSWNHDWSNTQIIPWDLTHSDISAHGDFCMVGIWNGIRLELLNKFHICRPVVRTESINNGSAELLVEFEIADGRTDELVPYYGYSDGCNGYTRAFDMGLTGAVTDDSVKIKIEISENSTGKTVFSSEYDEPLTDYDRLYMNPDYYELQFFGRKIKIDSPRLWFPHTIGKPELYNIDIFLSHNGEVCDVQSFSFGIKTFESRPTSGKKYRLRWENYRFSVNGRDFFLKGINWMPIDYLYSFKPEEYEWCIKLIKNAGIELIRVWSGGGIPETDTFYNLCDKYGIMVWQDHMLANMADTRNFPQDILEMQEAYNLYRIRNHPSLVIHCGGNEINPYNKNNASSMFVISRIIKILDPGRCFFYTTADGGSAHVYRDFDPVWYRHLYKDLPFMAESGIHSFPNYISLKKYLDKNECEGMLGNMASEEFVNTHPGLINRFVEYIPERIPQMLARVSQIGSIKNFTLEDMCEASQVQAYEFYSFMIQAMRENYPRCGGIMPWVFKRPWTTVGVQLADGDGRPTYAYYAVKNSYSPVSVILCLQQTSLAPGEKMPILIKVFDENKLLAQNEEISFTVIAPDMSPIFKKSAKSNPSNEYAFGKFEIPDNWADSYFLVNADLHRGETLLSRNTYFIKCLSSFSDEKIRTEYRSKPVKNAYFDNGPWLKDTVTDANRATLSAEISQVNQNTFKISVTNTSDFAAYPVTVNSENENLRFFANDNFCVVMPKETKVFEITTDIPTDTMHALFTVDFWNSDKIRL